jgi:dethiobiotin synthetase
LLGVTLAKRVFITATNTDIGKTYATKLLLETYASMGYRVGAFKPIETGVVNTPVDGSALLQLMHQLNPKTRHLHVNDIVPLQYTLPASPYVASGGVAIDFKKIDTALQNLERYCDIVLIEGAGGLMVPLDAQHKIIDLIHHLQAKALLVAHCNLGCINDLLLNLYLLKHHPISYEWCLNCHDDTSFENVSKPYFVNTFSSYYDLTQDIKNIAVALIN